MKDVVEIMARGICRAQCDDDEDAAILFADKTLGPHYSKTAQAALSALDAAGYQVVPKEPTEEMIMAGVPRLMSSGRGSNALCHAYRAMLAASSNGRNG